MVRLMRAHPILLLPLLLGALASVGLVQGVTFGPRGKPQAGDTWISESTWHTTGHNRVLVGGVALRDKPIDSLSHYVATVEIRETAQTVISAMSIALAEQVARDGDSSEDLDLDGVAVHGLGVPGERSFSRVDGGKLKRPQKKWLDEQFGGSADPDQVDPLEFLLPKGPTAPGDTWDMDLVAISEYFDTEKFRFDLAASRAQVTLVDVREWHGVQAGRFSFDVYLVPSWIDGGTINEAHMHITGSADLPTDGATPWMAFALGTDLRFDGSVKRKGIKADVDLTMHFDGAESQLPPTR